MLGKQWHHRHSFIEYVVFKTERLLDKIMLIFEKVESLCHRSNGMIKQTASVRSFR